MKSQLGCTPLSGTNCPAGTTLYKGVADGALYCCSLKQSATGNKNAAGDGVYDQFGVTQLADGTYQGDNGDGTFTKLAFYDTTTGNYVEAGDSTNTLYNAQGIAIGTQVPTTSGVNIPLVGNKISMPMALGLGLVIVALVVILRKKK